MSGFRTEKENDAKSCNDAEQQTAAPTTTKAGAEAPLWVALSGEQKGREENARPIKSKTATKNLLELMNIFALWFVFHTIILRQKCGLLCERARQCVRLLRHIPASTIIAKQLNNEKERESARARRRKSSSSSRRKKYTLIIVIFISYYYIRTYDDATECVGNTLLLHPYGMVPHTCCPSLDLFVSN